MLPSDKTIDHGTLRRLVDAGALIGAEVIGAAGGWGIVINYGRASQTLAVTRGEPRTFRKFETLANYLKELGITELRVHTGEFEAGTADGPSDKRRALASERMKRAHEAAAYDQWFRAQVQASIDAPRPNVPDVGVRATFAAKREALRARAWCSAGQAIQGPEDDEGRNIRHRDLVKALKWRPMAIADRDTIMEHIAADNATAAVELDAEFEAHADHACRTPTLYKPGRIKGTREIVVHPNDVMIYRVEAAAIVIVRVLHAAQQWPTAGARKGKGE